MRADRSGGRRKVVARLTRTTCRGRALRSRSACTVNRLTEWFPFFPISHHPCPQLLLHRIPTASPALACACFDLIMAIQLRQPAAFVAFVDHDGIKKVRRNLATFSAPAWPLCR